MKNIFSFKHRVTSYEVDYKNKMRYDMLLQIMQDVAGGSATELGASSDVLLKHDAAWVLSRIYLKINREPLFDEVITINTWPIKPMMTFHPRCFQVLSNDGEVLVEANTIWTILDIKERKISSFDLFSTPFPRDLEEKAILPLPRKIIVDNIDLSEIYYPKYSCIDTNFHVNNTKYVSWMFDLLPLEEIKNMKIVGITLNYVKEIYYNQKVEMGYKKENNSYLFSFVVDNEVCFNGKIDVEG